jgi:hypothetical protein
MEIEDDVKEKDRIRKEFAYDGKSKQWQDGFDAFMRHYLPEIRKWMAEAQCLGSQLQMKDSSIYEREIKRLEGKIMWYEREMQVMNNSVVEAMVRLPNVNEYIRQCESEIERLKAQRTGNGIGDINGQKEI